MARWGFLDSFNSTGFKGWSIGWLWIYTGAMWGVVTVIATWRAACGAGEAHLPTEFFAAWLSGLALYSGVGAYQFKTMRETDYGALERKAAGAPATPAGDT